MIEHIHSFSRIRIKQDEPCIHCRGCKTTWRDSNALNLIYLCKGCKEMNKLDQKTLDNCHTPNILCTKCSEKYSTLVATLNQMRCEGFESYSRRPVYRRNDNG
jgi:hypothetical protein